jgi:pyruvate/2-oxoglutarate dehydrogenase complex dihydrolipoamide dehydrogenase (E3) component
MVREVDMATFDFDIGIIGGGAAGLTVAAGAAQLGAKTVLIEKDGALGGDCLHYGCVPSKTLIKSARVYHQMKTADRFGLPHVDLPPVDFREIAKRIKSVIDTIQQHDSEQRFCKLGAKVVFGEAHFIDEHSLRLKDQTFAAKNWVIATGSSAVVPPIPGLAETPYLSNREIFYLDRLPSSMIILGAGPVGVEMGQAFNRLGTLVTIVDRSNQILGKEDRDMADAVKGVMAAEGVVFYLEASIESVADLGRRKRVAIKTADGQRLDLEAERIFIAMGRGANTNGLGLEKIGVEHDRRGIKVDRRLRTTQKHIYAAGDVGGGYQYTHAAGYEGGIVVSNAVFHLPRKTDYAYMPWCTYTDPPLGSIGMNETMARKAGIDYSLWTEEFKANDRSLAEGEQVGKIKMILDDKEKPIGVQIFGPHAGDLLCEWVAILNGKVKLSTLAAAVHPYPTIGEINRRVVGTFFSSKIFSDKIKKTLKFFFNLKGRACSLDEFTT